MGDRELCMAAFVQDWEALEFVSEEMKGNRELCTAAVAQDCLALKFVSEEMQGDRELFTAAVPVLSRPPVRQRFHRHLRRSYCIH